MGAKIFVQLYINIQNDEKGSKKRNAFLSFTTEEVSPESFIKILYLVLK
jgi:hypothetical protein